MANVPFKRGDIVELGTTPDADGWMCEWNRHRGAVLYVVSGHKDGFTAVSPFGPWAPGEIHGLATCFFTKIGVTETLDD